jgi:hypothetical protein
MAHLKIHLNIPLTQSNSDAAASMANLRAARMWKVDVDSIANKTGKEEIVSLECPQGQNS